MGIENNTPPTIEDAENWQVVMTYFQPDNNCDLTIKAEDSTTPIPANLDWSKTKLLEETQGHTPKLLLELPDGKRVLFSYSYRNRN